MPTHYDQNGNKLSKERAFDLLVAGHYIVQCDDKDITRIAFQKWRHFSGMTPEMSVAHVAQCVRTGIMEA